LPHPSRRSIHRTGRVAALATALALGVTLLAQTPIAAEKKPAARPDSDEVRVTERIWKLLAVRKGEDESRDLYLNLLKLSLTDLLYEDELEARAKRISGDDWPSRAYTMTGLRRLNNLQTCVEDVIANDVPGDLIEAGAWRGGATILMRGILRAYGVTDRTVWVADSFEGMPKPDLETYPHELQLDLSNQEYLAVSQEKVENNFRRYGLLDGQVRFLKGWFKDSLPDAPIEKLAVLRLDADLYESTSQALEYLYPKLQSGGCLIVDDYFIKACRRAVHDYRRENGITEKIVRIDHKAVYWKKR